MILNHLRSRPIDLTDWKLILYGTETSFEFDDELDKQKPQPPILQSEDLGNNGAYEERTEKPHSNQNVVDIEGDPWTGSQQLDRVSHPEAQKPTKENQTSGAVHCLNVSIDGRCLGGCLILLVLSYILSEPGWPNNFIVVTSSNSDRATIQSVRRTNLVITTDDVNNKLTTKRPLQVCWRL